MSFPTLTLPQLASLTGVEYRTLHNWVNRGLVTASQEQARGSGTQKIFTRDDALTAYVFADLRRSGVELRKLEEVAAELRRQKERPVDVLLINGVVKGASYANLKNLVRQMSPAFVYDVGLAAAKFDERIAA